MTRRGARRELSAGAPPRGDRMGSQPKQRRQGAPRQIAHGAVWAVGLAAVALALAVAGPLAFGARPYTVLSGSMAPAISAGDVIVVERIGTLEARVGDVVGFRDPADQRRTITHRIQRIRRDGAHVWFVTRGDANDHGERWRIAASGDLSRVVYTVPWAGHVAVLAGSTGPAGVLTAIVLLLVANELWRIWRPASGEPRGEVDRAGA
jgi:signal peptidase I